MTNGSSLAQACACPANHEISPNLYKREIYQFYKSKGICVYCHHEYAMINQTACPECVEKRAEQKRSRDKDPRNKDPQRRAMRNLSDKQRRQRYSEAGICVKCGAHKALPDHNTCFECFTKSRRYEKRKYEKKGKYKGRDLFIEQGLCFICGAPIKEGHKLCEKHYEIAANNMRNLNKRRVSNLKHPWRIDGKLLCNSKKKEGDV